MSDGVKVGERACRRCGTRPHDRARMAVVLFDDVLDAPRCHLCEPCDKDPATDEWVKGWRVAIRAVAYGEGVPRSLLSLIPED